MKTYFEYRESVSNPSLYTISIHEFHERLAYSAGSFCVFAARVLGLTFPEYLRMCRDVYGATLVGKNTKYPLALFKDEASAAKLVQLLNKQMNEIAALISKWENE